MSDYSYQPKAANDVLNNILGGQYIAGVVAACPGAGKTRISFILIEEYVRRFPNARVVVIVHNMKSLENQYLQDLAKSFVRVPFTFGDFRTPAQVQIGIATNAKNIEGHVDLMIVDEAHEYWGEKMITDAYKRLNPKHVVLMTGSPAVFNKHNYAVETVYKNHKKYYMHYISGECLSNSNVFSSATLDCILGAGSASEKIGLAFARAAEKQYNTKKVLIACSSVKEAVAVKKAVEELGRNPALSTSDTDIDNEKFESFRKGDKDVLVVVRRGILGFSDNNLTMVIDLRCSQDLQVRNQLFSRILRKGPVDGRKTYLSVVPLNKARHEVDMLKNMMKFMQKNFFVNYKN